MRSSSTFGLSLITVLFRDRYDDYFVRQRLLERINQVVLPNGATPSLDPVTGPGGEIYRYTLESDRRESAAALGTARWTVIPAIKSVSGVVDVTNFGGFTTEYQVNLEPKQLERYGLGITDVINAIKNNNANAGGGRISRGEQSYIIRGVGLIRTWPISIRPWLLRSTDHPCWCATWVAPRSATRSGRASSAKTTIPTPSKGSC